MTATALKPVLLAMLAASLALAGCGEPDGGTGGGGGTTGPLASGKGAISGLLIDDVFRPIPQALVLVQSAGLTATTDASGQFTFRDLEPGAYILRVQADGHEAAPQEVEVKAGEYAEAEVMARRVFNEGGRIVTTEYTIFMTCTVDLVVVSGNGINCFQDLSGESERTAFTTDLTTTANVTTLVSEIKFNQQGTYNYVIAKDDTGDNVLDRYWAELDIDEGNYGRIVLVNGEANVDAASGDRNEVWLPGNDTFLTTVFVHGLLYREMQDSPAGAYGLGVGMGIRAKVVQSVFIGEPEVDVASYCVLCD